MNLSKLVYVSQATRSLPQHELERLANSSAAKNADLDITGLLLFSGGHFLQLLEGDHDTIADLFKSIAKDPRHTDVQKLLFSAANSRMFGGWNMGLLNLDHGLELHRLAFTSTITHLRATDASSAKVGMALLHQFREQLPATA